MKSGEPTEGEAVRHKRTEDYIHSRIEALKAAAKRCISMEDTSEQEIRRIPTT
jgi:hypothetical protein